jgi:excisionase family DNA binding protein
MDVSRLLSPAEVAACLGVSQHTLAVWRCAKRYPLPYVKVGARVRYRQADLDAFLNARRLQSAPAA